MILFGSCELLPHVEFNDYYITNLSSMLLKYVGELRQLLPSQYMNFMSNEFMNSYSNHLLEHRMLLFSDVLVPSVVDGNNVYVLVTRNDALDSVTELLQHFILTRYGIMSYLVNSIEDIINLETTQTNDTVMRYPHHIHNFDEDLQLYWRMIGE